MDGYLLCRLGAGLVGLLLLAALAGHTLGKRRGRARGLSEGKALARLLLREEALLGGECPLCGAAPAATPGGRSESPHPMV